MTDSSCCTNAPRAGKRVDTLFDCASGRASLLGGELYLHMHEEHPVGTLGGEDY